MVAGARRQRHAAAGESQALACARWLGSKSNGAGPRLRTRQNGDDASMRKPQQVPQLTVGPIFSDEVSELTEALREQGVSDPQFARQSLGGFRVGDPGTLTVTMLLAQPAVIALGAFLMKRRTRKTMRYSARVDYPDGRVVQQELVVTDSDSAPPDAGVLEALQGLLQTPPGGNAELPQ